PAQADVPGGHFYVGMGAWWTVPAGSGARQWQPLRQDLGLSIDLTVEFGRGFAGLSLAFSGFNAAQPEFGMWLLRAGYVLVDGPYAPFLALGLGQAAIDGESTEDCLGALCYTFQGSGGVLSFEAGLLLFRANRFG